MSMNADMQALKRITLPVKRIVLRTAAHYWIQLRVTNPTNLTIGFKAKSTLPKHLIFYPKSGFLKPNSSLMIKLCFYRLLPSCVSNRKHDRLTLLFAVKPKHRSLRTDPEFMWRGNSFPPLISRQCINIIYKQKEATDKNSETNDTSFESTSKLLEERLSEDDTTSPSVQQDQERSDS
ncbi:hypothetical protein T11_17639 [Trichinella zimbabwensis]|uniref:Major sperm protein n=1 Tax=Trichinella zimbabwensis TaxID=268475 RepID=A0A0V1I478_9BILA|nr:hypothetical protein T11_17639 [Trichinella zimbabwensis]